jgi:hypothetical protein
MSTSTMHNKGPQLLMRYDPIFLNPAGSANTKQIAHPLC